MSDEYLGKVFKSGNSAALRLPKGLGIPEGTEVRMVKEARMTFRVEPVDAPKRKFNIDKIWGIGIGSGLQLIKDEDRIFEEVKRPWDDPDWPGWSEGKA